MNTINKFIIITLFILTISLLFICKWEREAKAENSMKIIGFYSLDIEKSRIPNEILSDFGYELNLEMKKNGTFVFSRWFPVLYDTVGFWTPRGKGVEDWSKMKFIEKDIPHSIPFSLWKEDSISFLSISSLKRQKGLASTVRVFQKIEN